MKVLVDSHANEIRGMYEEPLNFSLSGYYVIEVPQVLTIKPTSASPSAFIISKYSTLLAQQSDMEQEFHDEFLTSAKVDKTNSSRVVTGPNKTTVIYPGGTLITTPMSITVSSLSALICRWTGFKLHREVAAGTVPGPARMLYNYNPVLPDFEDFDPSDLTVTLLDAAFSPLGVTFTHAQVAAYAVATPTSVCLSFENTTTSAIYMSDWMLMAG